VAYADPQFYFQLWFDESPHGALRYGGPEGVRDKETGELPILVAEWVLTSE
jgi:hypothetical protein